MSFPIQGMQTHGSNQENSNLHRVLRFSSLKFIHHLIFTFSRILRPSHQIALPENIFPYPGDAKPCLQSRNLEITMGAYL
jgi:hypothetical protein